MTKVERELARLDGLRVPHLEGRIAARVSAPDGAPLELERRSVGSRLVAAVVALLLFAGVGFATWRVFSPAERNRIGGTPTPAPEGDPWAAYGPGWTALPEPPELRVGASVVWTGRELLVWSGVPSGSEEPAPDGFAFDPLVNEWRSMPVAPEGSSSVLSAPRPVWTGTEVLYYPAGLAFDPSASTWRELPTSPHDPGVRQTAMVWTGSEMVVFGGGDRGSDTAREGAAYDPTTDRWRPIADAPIGLNLQSAVWTGDEVIVFGSLLDGNNRAETQTSVGAAYDPDANTWRTLPSSELSPQATSAVWVGDRLIAWDYELRAQEYDPASDTWSEPVEMPMEFSECYPDSVVAGTIVFAWFCGQASILDADEGVWTRIRGGVLEPMIEANDQEYALFRFASLVGAGDVFAMVAEGITVGPGGEPCYGCPGAPLSYWVYRPPS
ncbi:MAG: hypothetical protein ACRDHU_07160 [Actinomycetota bacterium]